MAIPAMTALVVDPVTHAREIARFQRRIVRRPEIDPADPVAMTCAIWTGAVADDGYGRFSIMRAGVSTPSSHTATRSPWPSACPCRPVRWWSTSCATTRYACLRPGDVLVVASLDRLGRSLDDLLAIVAGLRKRGIGFRSLHESLDTSTPGGRLVFHVFAALAEFIRELIVEGTREGLAAARARGQRLGRPPALTPEQVSHARALLANPDNTVASIARLLNVSRNYGTAEQCSSRLPPSMNCPQ